MPKTQNGGPAETEESRGRRAGESESLTGESTDGTGGTSGLAFDPGEVVDTADICRADPDERVYTDAEAEIVSGHLVATLAGWDRYDDLERRLGGESNALAHVRKAYDLYEQEQPATFAEAPMLRRGWVAGHLPPGRPTEQEQRDHAEDHGYDDPEVLLKAWQRARSQRLETRRAEKRVDKATTDALRAGGVDPAVQFTPDEIERVHGGETWAQHAVRFWRDHNTAQRAQGRRSEALLTMTAAQLMTCGATPADLAAMRPAGTVAKADAARRLEAERIADAEEARLRARRITAKREGTTVSPPELLSLTDVLAEPDDDIVYRIADLWPVGGRVLLAAQYKAGKSTTVGNAVRSLADGDPFLGRFPTDPVGKVVLIDTELDPRTLRRWMRDQAIRKTAAVSVLPLRGRVSAFDILDRSVRSEWVTRLSGADVVILDCLRPVLDSLGLSEDKDAGKFLVAFDAMLADAGVGEAMVVTHMGHQNERARGDSRLLDWPEAPWKIVRDDNDVRYFSAFGRDVDVSEGALSFDPDTRRLTYEGGSRKDVSGAALVPDVLALLRENPGRSGREIETTLMNQGAAQADIRAALKSARRDGLVRVEPGPKRANLHYPAEGDPLDSTV